MNKFIVQLRRWTIPGIILFLLALCRPSPAAPFVWRNTVTIAPGGWTRMVHLRNGLWVEVTTLYPAPNSELQLSVSADNARTWHSLGKVIEPGRNLDNGQLVELPTGAMLLACRSVVDVHQPTTGRSYHLPVYISQNHGNSWVFLSEVSTSVDPPGHTAGLPSIGLWEPFLFLLNGGRVACAYSDETRSRDAVPCSQIIGEKVSTDDGATWGPETVVVAQPGGGSVRPGMPVVTRIKNGGYGVIYEVAGVGDADVHFKSSSDGVTWPEGLGTVVPDQHAGPFVTKLSSGRLVATSCQNSLSYSDDCGATWVSVTAGPPAEFLLSWPSIYQSGPREVAVMQSMPSVAIRFGTINP